MPRHVSVYWTLVQSARMLDLSPERGIGSQPNAFVVEPVAGNTIRRFLRQAGPLRRGPSYRVRKRKVERRYSEWDRRSAKIPRHSLGGRNERILPGSHHAKVRRKLPTRWDRTARLSAIQSVLPRAARPPFLPKRRPRSADSA